MRVRPLPLIGAIFGAAALAAAFVVTQFPREGEVSAPDRGAAAPGAAPGSVATPPLDGEATASDGAFEVRVAAGLEPQASAEVRLYLALADGTWRRAGEGRTGTDGVARLLARPGLYLVAVRAEGLAPGHAEAVRTAGDAATRVEVALEPAAILAGRVTARERGPLAGARVRAVPVVSRWPGLAPPSAPPEEIAAGQADPAGAFLLRGVAPGTWSVSVEAPGFHPVLLPRVAVPGDALSIVMEPLGRLEGTVRGADGRPAPGATVRAASADHGAAATAGPDGSFVLPAPAGSWRVHASLGERAGAAGPIAVVAGSTTRIELPLGPAALIEGEVVLGGSGRPGAGAEVAAFAHDSGEVLARATADGSGRFRLEGLAAGAVDVRASAPGASPALAPALTLAAGARFPLRLALQGTGSAEGVVLDPAGRPLAGVRVRVSSRGDGLPGAAPLEARTGFDGSWRIDGIEAGRAEIVAREEGVLAGVSRAVQVVPGRTSRVDSVLPEAGVLSGRVLRDGKPPPPGTVVVAVAMKGGLGGLQIARAQADASGNYSLALPAGEYRVHAAPAESARADLRVTPAFGRVEPGRSSRLDLRPARVPVEEGVEILVLEPGGAPSPGAVVTLTRPGEAAVAFATRAGEDGRVLVGREMGAAGRRVAIRARNGGRTGAATVELPPAGTVPVTLSPGGAVRGVVRARGRPVESFTIEIASQPEPAGWRTVDVHRFSGDRFELADLPAEPLRLVVRASDGRRGEAQVSLAAGEVRAVEVALLP